MWRNTAKEEEEGLFQKAVEFTGDAELYGNYMMRAVKEWPIACEHNLTATGVNRQAWVGHAACCIAIDCPEHIVRRAWHCLTQEQQDKANAKADEAIAFWESEYLKGVNTWQRLDWEQLSWKQVWSA